jgi:nicotinamidase-related amidase
MTHWALLSVLVGLGLVVVLLAALAFVGLRSGAAGTHGERIPQYDRPGSAVIVVDVQEDFTTWSVGRLGYAADALESFFSVVNRVQAEARRQAIPIVHIRHQFEEILARLFARLFVGSRGIAGRPGTRLDPRLEAAASDVTFTKRKGDSFSNPGLDAFLRSRNVEHVVILGLDGVACVHATVRGALNRGYRVSPGPRRHSHEQAREVACAARRARARRRACGDRGPSRRGAAESGGSSVKPDDLNKRTCGRPVSLVGA